MPLRDYPERRPGILDVLARSAGGRAFLAGAPQCRHRGGEADIPLRSHPGAPPGGVGTSLLRLLSTASKAMKQKNLSVAPGDATVLRLHFGTRGHRLENALTENHLIRLHWLPLKEFFCL